MGFTPTDTGTSNGSVLEKDLNLDVALRLGDLLVGNGYAVHYTRQDDATLTNTQRAKFCNGVGATVLVSVHHNGSSDPATDYSTALYQKRADRALAREVVDAVSTRLGTTNRGIVQFASGVLVKSDMPATISEGYFLTNGAQRAKLADFAADPSTCAYCEVEAQAIYEGIAAYFASR